ncbi:acyl-CoA dehydrogenase family protein [Sphingomonas azotifigens]|uniref:acyl-CoA dehydrogenase family protein n=1 Tax=Sphingomonas azotifigens TaxID=330920 RepID=UPI0009FE363D|nr:acyl-CoA dehydrogenase family protein [Sphingomonas azotifigens]
MDQERTDRIEMIRDSASAVVSADGDVSRIRGLRFGDRDFDAATWQEMLALGWIPLLVPEDAGGAGLGMGEYCALAEIMGRGLVPEPFVAAVPAVAALPDAARDAVLAGHSLYLPALGGNIAVRGGRLSGRCTGVLSARHADGFLILADTGFWVVEAGDVTLTSVGAQDGRSIATIAMSDSPARPATGDGLTAERLRLGIAAELLGIGQRAFDITLDHLRTRQQFGRAIGSFQALQHRCADLLVQIELARAAVDAAARAFDSGRERDAIRQAVSRAKARAGDMAMLVTRQGIQLHGGIGFADESDIGLYLRRAMVLVNQGGSPGWHRKRYGTLLAA